ncbi:aldose 1-epimerase [Muricauda sp. 2012CJ35-5]|uniref:Aldose 1-epimerase n=1 Tax=Flagellimonas spongiicola TaxID=2942208 RepID=A0ABT0PMM4_9FLAO|nr:aldose 1-epimerase [Allomuricauda spongiicola]MCL6272511.1 aldose 1-epimerase [Allomuricauda spongiicola]
MVKLNSGNSTVNIEAGELVGFVHDGHEYIHQKGSPGWGSSDTEMFPIVGPVNEANFAVQVPRGSSVQDQHGLLRLLEYKLVDSTKNKAIFRKAYTAGTPVKNAKYPEKSPKQWLMWPYSFQFEKTYELQGKKLEITFTITGEHDMPFMLGYHPAFKLHSADPLIIAGERQIELKEVMESGSRALPILETDSITLRDQRTITIEAEGFGNFMCWTEVPNMVCIEPVSFYPYAVEQRELHLGFQYLNAKEAVFKVRLKVEA